MRLVRSVLLAGILFGSCERGAGNAEVTIRNDIQDSEYNSITIDKITGSSGSSGFSKTLNPGDEVPVPVKGLTSVRFTREYADYARVYVVRCPAKKPPIVLKLIDVHLNRLPGGCSLIRYGEARGGVTRWIKGG